MNTQSTKSSISTTSKSETCFTRHRGFIFIVCLPGYSRNKIRQPWPSFLLNILVAPIIRLRQLSTNRNPSTIINSTTLNIKRQTFGFKIHYFAFLSQTIIIALQNLLTNKRYAAKLHSDIYFDTRECRQKSYKLIPRPQNSKDQFDRGSKR